MKQNAFTLSELLIALLILGVIATFTIPKVLQTQQASKDKSVTKEVVSMVSGAWQAYKQQGNLNATTWYPHITPFMNYVKADTTTLLDDCPGFGTVSCSNAGMPCLKLHNGAILRYDLDQIGGTTATHALYFMVVPDGKSGSINQSVYFLIYANGKIRTWGTMENPTVTQTNTYTPNPAYDPAWFSWN